jgi:hypothetical protein
MKPLRPTTLLAVGSPLAGIAVSVGAALVSQDELTARTLLIWFVVGAAIGALMLLPIALIEAFRPSLVRALGPYAFHIEAYASLVMAAAFGYMLSSMRQGVPDGFAVLAGTVLFVGAVIKVATGLLFGSRQGAGA